VARLLEIQNLRVTLQTDAGPLHAVRGIDLSLERGETLCLVGESGCGKSMTALAIMGLLPRGARLSAGRLALSGTDLTQLGERRMHKLRGRQMGMVFQDPGTALNPVYTVGSQTASVWRRHFGGTRTAARERAVELLEKVGIHGAAARMSQYPHQLSGGLRQRIMIAMALIAQPALLLADEPTTALDVTVQARVLNLLRGLQRELGIGLLLITHDLGIVAAMADRVAVMYAGEVVETGPAQAILARPSHPYTQRLMACVPDLAGARRLGTIPGEVSSLTGGITGCGFAPRCDRATSACQCGTLPLHPVAVLHDVRCVHPGERIAAHV
jgi:peptide/nickel transport system ATP-binding protein